MSQPLVMVNLFVQDIERAEAFYTRTLGFPKLDQLSAPGFIAIQPAGGSLIGLQDAATLPEGIGSAPGGVELNFEVEDADAVYRAWRAKDVNIVIEPGDMPYGRTFLARDPDGHYLRVSRLKQ